jgi:hypothetical protein
MLTTAVDAFDCVCFCITGIERVVTRTAGTCFFGLFAVPGFMPIALAFAAAYGLRNVGLYCELVEAYLYFIWDVFYKRQDYRGGLYDFAFPLYGNPVRPDRSCVVIYKVCVHIQWSLDISFFSMLLMSWCLLLCQIRQV